MELSDLDIIFSRIPHFNGSIYFNIFGDALCLDNFDSYLRKIRRQWPDARLISTSSLNRVKDRSFFASIFNSGLNQIRISCYGYTEDDYQKLHGTDGFERVCRNISLIRALDGIPNDALMPIILTKGEEHFGIDSPSLKKRTYLRFLQNNGIQKVDLRNLHTWQGKVAEITSSDDALFQPYPCPVVWGSIMAGTLNITAQLDIIPCSCLGGDDGIILGNLADSSLDEIFNSQKYIRFYKNHWAMRKGRYHPCLCCDYVQSVPPSSHEHCRLASWAGARLAGKKTYFWGYGEVFRSFGIFFAQAVPQAVLVDTEGSHPVEINGIPVLHPDDVLLSGEKLPLVIFVQQHQNEVMLRKIAQKYPRYTEGDIVLAVPGTVPRDTYHDISHCCPANLRVLTD
jgi:hypothetical protein